MICCEKCFKDAEIKGIIRSLKRKGDCETCRSKNAFIYDTNENNELTDNFNHLLGIYTSVSSLPKEFPKEKLSLLKDTLKDKWNIFNIGSEWIYLLIRDICKEKYEEDPELFDSPVGILEMNESAELKAYSILIDHNWDVFKEEIKTNNRFHKSYINTSALEALFSYMEINIEKGQKLYRARISNQNGYPIAEMGAPPAGKSSSGRVNPEGINYLYLAAENKTAISEVRAAAYDYVTVGEFILEEDVTVVDFTEIDKISPFSGIDVLQLAINIEHLNKINIEIAKPLRRNDSPLEYLPTQYIADFIKSLQSKNGQRYAGIKYKSTLHMEGFNIAFFDEKLFKCTNALVYEVDKVDYRYQPLDE
ncbi:RES family NAD+ phosphorylase [Oceanobacillus locisalsi]|uniref:RES family NAD+ phosphorylase n=1 Tax=Oceanobacillus locisalsi TaxID=546107 RepID=A0ABW3NDH0_9BACI